MTRIVCGPASTSFAIADGGVAVARTVGLFQQANSGALSAQLLQASADQGAMGLLISMEGVAFALPAMTPQHYRYVPPNLRDVPVALVVNAEQAAFLEGITQTAAQAGTMRQVFLSRALAQAWIRQQVGLLAANRGWWSAQRSQR